MSTFKKSGLSLAVLGALATFSGAASAMTTAYATNNVARNLYGDNINKIVAAADLDVTAQAADVFLGRTTGFNVNVTLSGGKFSRTVVAGDIINEQGGAEWTGSVVGGGAIGDTTVTIGMQPDATPTALTSGKLFDLAAAAIELDNLGSVLNTVGGKVTATITFRDPVGGQVLATTTKDLFAAVEGVTFTPAGSFTTVQRIDVAGGNSYSSKTLFSTSGVIGTTLSRYFNAGSFAVGVAGNASVVAGSAVLENDSNAAVAGGLFNFDVIGGTVDQYTLTMTGTDLSPFTAANGGNVFSSTGAGADTVLCTADDAGIVNAATVTATTATFPATNLGATGTGTLNVCFDVGTSGSVNPVIAEQTVTATVAVDLKNTGTIDPSNGVTAMSPMQYNGSVVKVFTVNPASNATQVSLLRITNTGSTVGKVTLTGIDDAGVAGNSAITFNLAAGNSILLDSTDLESGNASKGLTGAFGDKTGKWVVTATGEFDGMFVSSLNRNNTDGTLTNISATANAND